MLSTFLVRLLVAGAFVASIPIWAILLEVGLYWAKVRDASVWRVTGATLLAVTAQWALAIVLYFTWPERRLAAIGCAVGALLAAAVLAWVVIRHVFKASPIRSVQAWLPTLLTPAVVIAIILLVCGRVLFEAFVSPTNAMAPTILGKHWEGTCVACGGSAYCSPVPPEYASFEAPRMICRDNFHVTQPADGRNPVLGPDRFLVAKFLRPRRWDIVVFRYPEDPSVLFVMRLVGLPGETITIVNGQVLADGRVLTPPAELSGITYLSQMPGWDRTLWGTPARPAQLGEGEYFVLGDNSGLAKDSRLWERGAEGCHPFAVPESYVYGVVTNICWPTSRMRVLR
ncbi:MAG: signal peptidase I [Pirellulales bacterium]